MSILTPGTILKPRKILRDEKQPSLQQAWALCQAFSNGLGNIFPGHAWRASLNQTMMSIFCDSLSSTHCYTAHLSEFDPEGRKLYSMGAEILERFGMTIGPAVKAEYVTVKRDFVGNAIPEL